jgi:hypothetical protein
MATITEVRSWSDSKLAAELRNPARERFPVSYTVLLAEATARLLEERNAGFEDAPHKGKKEAKG